MKRPLVVSVAADIRRNYERERSRQFRRQIGVIVNLTVIAILLHQLLALVFPGTAVIIPPVSMFLALGAEILIWIVSRRLVNLSAIRLLALAMFLIPLGLLVRLETLDISYYLIIIFVIGFLVPWNAVESAVVSALPLAFFLIVRGRQHEWAGLAGDLSVFLISMAIVTTLQLRQERDRRTRFILEMEAEEARRDLRDGLAIASKLHKDIISGSADFPGLSARVLYESMQELGGDYVKIRALDEKRVSMLVADVTGHGTPAALMVNRINTKVEGIMSAKKGPAGAAEELNRFVTRTFEGTAMLMSALWAEYDVSQKVMIWSNYGHPPPILIDRVKRDIRLLSSNAYVMGIDIPQETPSNTLNLALGDFLIFYTDGLIEVKTADGVFDLPALLEYLRSFLLEKTNHFTADDLLAALAEAVEDRRVGEAKDDLLAIVWEVKSGR